jgi:dolichol-phosphate mannosyltransferase
MSEEESKPYPFIPPPRAARLPGLDAVASREQASIHYWSRRDTLNDLRTAWRATTVRHMFHLLPGEALLELGAGAGNLTQALVKVTRGECPITAATFVDPPDSRLAAATEAAVEIVALHDLPGLLAGRQFDYVVATNLLDLKHGPAILREVYTLLKPGGRLLFFETNPWNPIYWLRRQLSRLVPFLRRGDERALPNQIQLYELLSEIGFVSIGASCYDFLYWPIPRWMMIVFRNLTLILENTPVIRRFAGAIFLYGQKPPRSLPRPAVRMTEHAALHGAVSVVVPCYNEEMNIGPLVEGLLKHYGEYIDEIVLVDDNSKDRTREVMRELAAHEPRVRPVFRTPPNGVGRALRDGLAATTGRYVLLMDCDFLHILPELRDMFDAAARGSAVVLGSRFSRYSVLINYPLRKILCNRCFHILLSFLFRRRLRDVTNNLKLLRRDVVDNLKIESPWFAANAETGLKPLLMGYPTHVSSISWINRTPEMGQSSFSLLSNGIGYIRVLGKMVWRSRFGLRLLPGEASPEPADDIPIAVATTEDPSFG